MNTIESPGHGVSHSHDHLKPQGGRVSDEASGFVALKSSILRSVTRFGVGLGGRVGQFGQTASVAPKHKAITRKGKIGPSILTNVSPRDGVLNATNVSLTSKSTFSVG